jgi:segregation and condensation protein B
VKDTLLEQPSPLLTETPTPISQAVMPQPLSVELKTAPALTLELRVSQPLSVELKVPQPLSVELKVAHPLSVELKTAQPISVELKVAYPESIELKLAYPISVELKTAYPLSFELKTAQPLSVELKTALPISVELKTPLPLSFELKLAPVMEILLLEDLISSLSEKTETLIFEPFSPGLTTQLPEPETDSQAMAVGQTHELSLTQESHKEVAMSPKHPKHGTISDEHSKADQTAADLEAAASEWSTDPIATGHTADDSESSGKVSLIEDPSGLGSSMSRTREIADAQRSDEELSLDEDLDLSSEDSDDEEATPLEISDNESEIEETLTRLQEKMASEEAKLSEAASEEAAMLASTAKDLLAAQIAEDEALEKAMQEESESDLANDPELRAALPREPEEDESGELDLREMESCIEALLFMSEKPLSAAKLRELLGPDMSLHYFQSALTNLKTRYARLSHGIELVEIAHGYQFRTKPARAPLAKKLAKIQTQRLSTGAMESLAIIAYKQPVMKDDIDKIRGVDSSHFIRGLLDKKLIKIIGRSELPGRPMLYATSTEFLEIFSLKSLDALPPLRELESMVPGSQSGNPDDGDPRVKKMRELVSEMNSDHSVSLLYDPKEDEKFLTEIRERVKSIEIITPTLQAQADEVEAQKVSEKERRKAIAAGTLDPQAESFATAVAKTEPGDTAEMPIEP